MPFFKRRPKETPPSGPPSSSPPAPSPSATSPSSPSGRDSRASAGPDSAGSVAGVETTSANVDGIGEVGITIDRSGDVPEVTISLPQVARLGLALNAKRQELGDTHPETLHIAHLYAVELGELPERRDDAIDLLEWLARVRADVDVANWLLTLNDLSRILQDYGHPARAEPVLRDALSGWERHRGQNDPETLKIANNLAMVLIELDRPDEAEGLLRDTVARNIRVLGAAHRETVRSRITLAGTLRGSPARLAEAERMYRAILDDLDDPASEQGDAVWNNLAAVQFHQGDLTAAEATFRRVLADRTAALGPDHPTALQARGNLAAVLNSLGHTTEAERETAAVLKGRRRVLGPRHPATLDTQVNLAALRANQGRVAEALPLLTDAIKGFRATHGPDHPMIHELNGVLAQLRRQS
jgi:tetratricopeptide (TPR) repeat protein